MVYRAVHRSETDLPCFPLGVCVCVCFAGKASGVCSERFSFTLAPATNCLFPVAGHFVYTVGCIRVDKTAAFLSPGCSGQIFGGCGVQWLTNVVFHCRLSYNRK